MCEKSIEAIGFISQKKLIERIGFTPQSIVLFRSAGMDQFRYCLEVLKENFPLAKFIVLAQPSVLRDVRSLFEEGEVLSLREGMFKPNGYGALKGRIADSRPDLFVIPYNNESGEEYEYIEAFAFDCNPRLVVAFNLLKQVVVAENMEQLSERKRNFQKERLREQFLRFADFPQNVGISLGDFNCIYKCRMCPQYNIEMRKKNFMDFDTFKLIVDQLPERDVSVEISAMGEPLMIKDIDKFIKYVKAKRPSLGVVLATNGRLLGPELAEKLIDSGLDHLQFSLDAGSRESYRWLCGSDNYDKVVSNLMNLVEMRNKKGARHLKIAAHIIGIKELESEFDLFLNTWKGIVDQVSVRSYGNWGGLVNNNGCTPLAPPPEERYPCLWPWYSMKIASNGDVEYCFIQTFSDEPPVGNIREAKLEDIWKGERLNEIRRLFLEGKLDRFPLCKNCSCWSLFPNVWYFDGKRWY
ncbi:MAG: radical SAM/SPASM domain-containing protein [bacterium]